MGKYDTAMQYCNIIIVISPCCCSPSFCNNYDGDIRSVININNNVNTNSTQTNTTTTVTTTATATTITITNATTLNQVTTLNNKGISVYYLDKYNESIFYFDKALSIDPNDIDALYYKGGAFDKLGNYNQDYYIYE